ncbi:MAG: hypothetical protein ACRECH_02165 [Nitrososphaerales archaeon]
MVLEEASLEILPGRLRAHVSAKRVQQIFGVNPEMQILDSNFHRSAMSSLKDLEKRGRPDVVHLALLDATSTPLFSQGKVKITIHTRTGSLITLKTGTRPPRTLQRFCGVAAKILSSEIEEKELNLFDVTHKVSFEELLSSFRVQKTVALTKLGAYRMLDEVIQGLHQSKRTAWIVGGFAHGHFRPEVTESSDEIISISNESLAAHVVTARLCYELERSLGM